MKKRLFKRVFIVLVLLISTISLFGCNKTNKKIENFPEYVANLESYKLTGKLYSMFPTGTKESLITVYYQKPDNYRVELDNSTNGDKQIILKNTNGVYILVPSLNKSFQIKSGWPINSSYPYLLQSISKDFVNDEDKLITEENNNVVVEMDVKMFENAGLSKQKVLFSKETKLPTEIQVFDEQQNLVSRFVFLNFEENIDLENDLFEKEPTMTSSVETYSQLEYTRVNTYPTYYPTNTELKDEKIIRSGEVKTVIMNYHGDIAYTIVEEYVFKNDLEKTDYVDGDIYILGDSVAVVNKTNLTFVSGGIEYFIASNNLSILEMARMGNSLLNGEEK